jgi:hypothetical protein
VRTEVLLAVFCCLLECHVDWWISTDVLKEPAASISVARDKAEKEEESEVQNREDKH